MRQLWRVAELESVKRAENGPRMFPNKHRREYGQHLAFFRVGPSAAGIREWFGWVRFANKADRIEVQPESSSFDGGDENEKKRKNKEAKKKERRNRSQKESCRQWQSLGALSRSAVVVGALPFDFSRKCKTEGSGIRHDNSPMLGSP
jgi:hypothetical protein